ADDRQGTATTGGGPRRHRPGTDGAGPDRLVLGRAVGAARARPVADRRLRGALPAAPPGRGAEGGSTVRVVPETAGRSAPAPRPAARWHRGRPPRPPRQRGPAPRRPPRPAR